MYILWCAKQNRLDFLNFSSVVGVDKESFMRVWWSSQAPGTEERDTLPLAIVAIVSPQQRTGGVILCVRAPGMSLCIVFVRTSVLSSHTLFFIGANPSSGVDDAVIVHFRRQRSSSILSFWSFERVDLGWWLWRQWVSTLRRERASESATRGASNSVKNASLQKTTLAWFSSTTCWKRVPGAWTNDVEHDNNNNNMNIVRHLAERRERNFCYQHREGGYKHVRVDAMNEGRWL